MLTPAQALSKAKIQLMSRPDSAFFTTLCFNMEHVFTDQVNTAATNGKKILYNPDFFMTLNEDERVFLLIHETMHVAYMHMLRIGDRNHKKWNIATDHVINLQLIERKFKMPQNGLADPQFKGMGAEEIYALLPDPPPDFEPDLLPAEGDIEVLEEHIKDAVIQATIQSKASGDAPGTIPGEIDIFLQRLLNPKLPWQAILRKYLQNLTKNDYSWRKPNRRFFPEYHLPSLYGHGLINLVVAVDTSGSVSDDEFQQIVSEIASILKMMKPSKLTVLQFDTTLKEVVEVKSLKELKDVKFTGRGGTHIQPVLDWVEKARPQLTLVFSDGFFQWPTQKHKNPFIWLTHNNPQFTAPFGKVIHYEM